MMGPGAGAHLVCLKKGRQPVWLKAKRCERGKTPKMRSEGRGSRGGPCMVNLSHKEEPRERSDDMTHISKGHFN